MRNILSIILILIYANVFSQELTTIKITVPNKTDEVYIVGNQESIGDWNPSNVLMNKISDFEREIVLKLTFPATFKFTRGNWDSEGIIGNYQKNNPNNTISVFTENINYNIKGWTDDFNSDSYIFSFQLESHYSEILNENRTIAVSLPDNYNSEKIYSVIYVLDAETLLEPVLINSKLLTAKDIIPEIIIVGIFHNNRGYEVEPNLGYNTDLDGEFLLEGTEKFKNYLFNEVIPLIDKKYNTSKYNSIIGHSDTGHFVLNLPFQELNPFQGIVALSVNSEFDYFKKRVSNYLKTQNEIVFFGYGSFDNGYKELALEIDNKIKRKEFNNPNLKVSEFNASHNQLPVLAMSSAIKFLYNDYRNFNIFLKASANPNLNIEKEILKYISINEKYGESISFKKDDLITLIDLALEMKDINLFRQTADYSNKQENGVEKHLLFYFAKELGDIESADKYINEIIESKDENDYELVYSNLEYNYVSYFLNIKENPNQALAFLEKMINKSDKYKLEFAYTYAKISITNGIEKKKSQEYLKYCERNFKENRIFDKDDLKKLR